MTTYPLPKCEVNILLLYGTCIGYHQECIDHKQKSACNSVNDKVNTQLALAIAKLPYVCNLISKPLPDFISQLWRKLGEGLVPLLPEMVDVAST